MKTSTLAMPVGTTDPVIAYRKQLRPSLAEQIPIDVVPEDLRTPEIAKDVERIAKSLNERSKQIESETKELRAMEDDYQRLLLLDRQAAVKLKSSILAAQDAVTQLSAQSGADKD